MGIKRLDFKTIDAHFGSIKSAQKGLYYQGDIALLKRPKVSIVGTRRPSSYTQEFTFRLAQGLARRGVAVVSGAAMGVDTIAHQGAGAHDTIAVMGNGLDIRYPAVNAELIKRIEESGLCLSPFEPGFRATKWSFVVRNELIVALGEVLVIAQADLESGSMRSAQIAQRLGKKIWVLPHRLGESDGTHRLLANNQAEAIEDIELFLSRFGSVQSDDLALRNDPLFLFCQNNPTFDEALAHFGDRIYEAELEGLIEVVNGRVRWRKR